jgi:hypothetical protein
MSDKLVRTHAEVADHCAEVAKLFKPGARVTILIRNPHLDDGDMVVSDDALDSAIRALERLKTKEEHSLADKRHDSRTSMEDNSE